MNSNAVDVAAAFRPLKKPTEVFRLEIRWSSLTDLLFGVFADYSGSFFASGAQILRESHE